MFYTSETIAAYLRDHIHLPHIRLLEGDGGLNFFEVQVFLLRIATEFAKDSKNEHAVSLRKLIAFAKLK